MLNTITAEVVRIALRYVAGFLTSIGLTGTATSLASESTVALVAGIIIAAVTEIAWMISKRLQAKPAGTPEPLR